MRILGFDTATRATTVALSGAGAQVLEARDDPPAGGRPGHASRLLPLVAEVMERGELEFGDLDRIAVGVGPGTFTGLRIGIATAQAIARAASLPAVAVPTLRSLAVAAGGAPQASDADAVVAVLDARRGEVYAAAWRPNGETVLPACAIAPDGLGAALADALGAGAPDAHGAAGPDARGPALADRHLRLLAVGDGAVEFRQVLERYRALVPPDESELHRVTAAAHLRIAEEMPAVGPDEIQPEYIRLPDVGEPSSHPAPGPT